MPMHLARLALGAQGPGAQERRGSACRQTAPPRPSACRFSLSPRHGGCREATAWLAQAPHHHFDVLIPGDGAFLSPHCPHHPSAHSLAEPSLLSLRNLSLVSTPFHTPPWTAGIQNSLAGGGGGCHKHVGMEGPSTSLPPSMEALPEGTRLC